MIDLLLEDCFASARSEIQRNNAVGKQRGGNDGQGEHPFASLGVSSDARRGRRQASLGQMRQSCAGIAECFDALP